MQGSKLTVRMGLYLFSGNFKSWRTSEGPKSSISKKLLHVKTGLYSTRGNSFIDPAKVVWWARSIALLTHASRSINSWNLIWMKKHIASNNNPASCHLRTGFCKTTGQSVQFKAN